MDCIKGMSMDPESDTGDARTLHNLRAGDTPNPCPGSDKETDLRSSFVAGEKRMGFKKPWNEDDEIELAKRKETTGRREVEGRRKKAAIGEEDRSIRAWGALMAASSSSSSSSVPGTRDVIRLIFTEF